MTALRRQWRRLAGCILWQLNPARRDVIAEAEAIKIGLAW